MHASDDWMRMLAALTLPLLTNSSQSSVSLLNHASCHPPFQYTSMRIRTLQGQPTTNTADFRRSRLRTTKSPTLPPPIGASYAGIDLLTSGTVRASVIEANLAQSQGSLNVLGKLDSL